MSRRRTSGCCCAGGPLLFNCDDFQATCFGTSDWQSFPATCTLTAQGTYISQGLGCCDPALANEQVFGDTHITIGLTATGQLVQAGFGQGQGVRYDLSGSWYYSLVSDSYDVVWNEDFTDCSPRLCTSTVISGGGSLLPESRVTCGTCDFPHPTFGCQCGFQCPKPRSWAFNVRGNGTGSQQITSFNLCGDGTNTQQIQLDLLGSGGFRAGDCASNQPCQGPADGGCNPFNYIGNLGVNNSNVLLGNLSSYSPCIARDDFTGGASVSFG